MNWLKKLFGMGKKEAKQEDVADNFTAEQEVSEAPASENTEDNNIQ